MRPDAASMPVNDTLHNRKPYSCSLELAPPVETLKGSKELLRVCRIKPCAIVFH